MKLISVIFILLSGIIMIDALKLKSTKESKSPKKAKAPKKTKAPKSTKNPAVAKSKKGAKGKKSAKTVITPAPTYCDPSYDPCSIDSDVSLLRDYYIHTCVIDV
jgi:hypothetical protein